MKKVLFLTVVFGVARFVVPVAGAINKADIFKDMAHIFVGGLFGAAILATVLKKYISSYWSLYALPEAVVGLQGKVNKLCLYLWTLALGLSILEVVAFIILKS